MLGDLKKIWFQKGRFSGKWLFWIITVTRKVFLSFSMQIMTTILRIDRKIAVKEPFFSTFKYLSAAICQNSDSLTGVLLAI